MNSNVSTTTTYTGTGKTTKDSNQEYTIYSVTYAADYDNKEVNQSLPFWCSGRATASQMK